MVHFDDLLNSLEYEIKRVATFLDISVFDDDINKISQLVSFSHMKKNADILLPNSTKTYREGNNSFFNSGTSKQWKIMLNDSQLSDYERVANRELTQECKKWLEGK